MNELTHLDAAGRARMVDVGDKDATDRRAVARAVVKVSAQTARAVQDGDAPKGDVLGVARIAGIQAAKRTSELIPLCHPLALTFVGVEGVIDIDAGQIMLTAEARTTGPTGVEMEALTAATVAALTVYDMVKGIERGAKFPRSSLCRNRAVAPESGGKRTRGTRTVGGPGGDRRARARETALAHEKRGGPTTSRPATSFTRLPDSHVGRCLAPARPLESFPHPLRARQVNDASNYGTGALGWEWDARPGLRSIP